MRIFFIISLTTVLAACGGKSSESTVKADAAPPKSAPKAASPPTDAAVAKAPKAEDVAKAGIAKAAPVTPKPADDVPSAAPQTAAAAPQTADAAPPMPDASAAVPADVGPDTPGTTSDVKVIADVQQTEAEKERAARLAELAQAYPTAALPDTGARTSGLWYRLVQGATVKPVGATAGVLYATLGATVMFARLEDGSVRETVTEDADKRPWKASGVEGSLVRLTSQTKTYHHLLEGEYEGSVHSDCTPLKRKRDLLVVEYEGSEEGWYDLHHTGVDPDMYRPELACADDGTLALTAHRKGVDYRYEGTQLTARRKDVAHWRRDLGKLTPSVHMETAGNVLLISDALGAALQVVARRTGQTLWKLDKPRPWSSGKRGVYVVEDKTLKLLAYADGSELWKHTFDKVLGGVVAYGGHLYLGLGDGLLAFTEPKVKPPRVTALLPLTPAAKPQAVPAALGEHCVTALPLPDQVKAAPEAVRAAASRDGRVAVGTTVTSSSTATDALLWLLDADLHPTHSWRLAEWGAETLLDVAFAADGGLVAAVHSPIYGSKHQHMVLLRLAKDGSATWDRNIGRRAQDRVRALVVRAADIVVAGTAKFSSRGWLGGWPDSDGKRPKPWNRWVGKKDRRIRPDALLPVADGLVMAGMRSYAKGSEPRLWLARTDTKGKKAKQAVFGALDERFDVRLALGDDGSGVLAAVAASEPKDGATTLRLVAFDPESKPTWSHDTGLKKARYALIPGATGGWLLWSQDTTAGSKPSVLTAFDKAGKLGKTSVVAGVAVGDAVGTAKGPVVLGLSESEPTLRAVALGRKCQP